MFRLYSGYYDQHNLGACVQFEEGNSSLHYHWSQGKLAQSVHHYMSVSLAHSQYLGGCVRRMLGTVSSPVKATRL